MPDGSVTVDAQKGGDGGCDSGVPGVSCVATAGPIYVNGDIAVDEQNVYWIAYGQTPAQSVVMRAPRAGGIPSTLAHGDSQGEPQCLASDGTSLYWGESGSDGGTIQQVPIGGGAAATLATAGSPLCIAVDDTNVYWTNGANWSVMKVAKTGGAPMTVTATGSTTEPGSVVVDTTNVYWVGGSLMQVGKDGGTPVTLLDAAPGAIGFGCRQLALLGGSVVVAASQENQLLSVPVTGAAGAAILAATSDPYAVVANSAGVDWLGIATQIQLNAVPDDGGTVTALAMPQGNTVRDLALASDGTLYWTTNVQVQSFKP